jgi:hypothetical protein
LHLTDFRRFVCSFLDADEVVPEEMIYQVFFFSCIPFMQPGFKHAITVVIEIAKGPERFDYKSFQVLSVFGVRNFAVDQLCI